MDARYVRDHLTPDLSEEERAALVHLAEEASEVVQAVTKILRWGFDSYDPRNPELGTNRQRLDSELHDIKLASARLGFE